MRGLLNQIGRVQASKYRDMYVFACAKCGQAKGHIETKHIRSARIDALQTMALRVIVFDAAA